MCKIDKCTKCNKPFIEGETCPACAGLEVPSLSNVKDMVEKHGIGNMIEEMGVDDVLLWLVTVVGSKTVLDAIDGWVD